MDNQGGGNVVVAASTNDTPAKAVSTHPASGASFSAGRPQIRSTFWCAFWLAAAMIACKTYAWGLPSTFSLRACEQFVFDLWIVTHADLVYALAVGLIGQLLILATYRHAWIGLFTWLIFLSVCAASVFFAIVSVPIFAVLKSPLTYSLIYLGGDAQNMSSSIGAYVSTTILFWLVAGPVLFLAISIFSNRALQFRRTRGVRLAQLSGIALVLVQGYLAGRAYHQTKWFWNFDRRLSESPHYVLIKSCVDACIGDAATEMGQIPPDAYFDDFKPVGQRPTKAADNETDQMRPTPALFGGGEKPQQVNWNGDFLGIQQVPWAATALNVKPAPVRPKNVILLVMESTGVQNVSLYYKRRALEAKTMGITGVLQDQFAQSTTPNLEKEAADSVVFDNFYSHDAYTASSLFAMTLSTYPGITYLQYTNEHPDIAGVTLAQVLHDRNYRTAFMSAAGLDFAYQRNFLQGRGFDQIWDKVEVGGDHQLNSWGTEDRLLVDSMLSWIDRGQSTPSNSGEKTAPFFLMAWTNQTHHPYTMAQGQEAQPIAPAYSDENLRKYSNCLQETDRQIERLLNGLRSRHVADDTLVVITGDHGEAFGWPHPAVWFHGGEIYQECVNVPCIIWNPRLEQRGTWNNTLGGHVDLNPTILDALGIPDAAPKTWQGRSLFDPDRPDRVYFFAAEHDYNVGVRQGNWKLIFNATEGQDNLFNLAVDPFEQLNVAAQNPEICQELHKRLTAWSIFQRNYLAQLTGVPKRPSHSIVSYVLLSAIAFLAALGIAAALKKRTPAAA